MKGVFSTYADLRSGGVLCSSACNHEVHHILGFLILHHTYKTGRDVQVDSRMSFRQSGSSQDWKDKVGLSEESKTVVGNTGHYCSVKTVNGAYHVIETAKSRSQKA